MQTHNNNNIYILYTQTHKSKTHTHTHIANRKGKKIYLRNVANYAKIGYNAAK